MLKVLFTQDSKVEDLFCGASPCSEPSLFFSNNLFFLGFGPVQDDSQHDFTWMTDEANASLILAELYVALFRPLCMSMPNDSVHRKIEDKAFCKNRTYVCIRH